MSLLTDRPTEDQFYCRGCQGWVSTPAHGDCSHVAVPTHPCGIPLNGIPFDTPTEVRAKMLAMHGHEAAVHPTPGWRNHTKADFRGCPHTVMAVLEVTFLSDGSDDVRWQVDVCEVCGSEIARHCPHTRNTWNEAGTVLTCDNCGVDGT